ncbi:VC_2705 family sodium/solute symporter [Rhizobacter sp. LjRoot28]|uniref:sodium:solute symporter family protein n=1 Tax=Rhizobacter sp. LjRoot28 TaxID=3342309 RepID=UPI003ECFD2B2
MFRFFPEPGARSFTQQLNRIYAAYAVGLLAFIAGMVMLEQMGLAKRWIGLIFLLATVVLYAGIGMLCRTTDAEEYFVAGRRVPAFYNGMATAADWMSAASFISLAGTVYLQGYAGLAFILGWTGGYCLVALLLAPYLRKFGGYTIPDFLGERYGGHLARGVAVVAAVMCSFLYVVAQIYGVGLITTRLTGVTFEIGIFLGLGGVLVCSFLGGMRAVTWTQVAQYIVLIMAYLVPVVWLSVKQTGDPVPQVMYGPQLQQLSERERELARDPKELEVRALFQARADEQRARLADVPAALSREHDLARQRVDALRIAQSPLSERQAAERSLAALPGDEAAARQQWSQAMANEESRARPLGGMPPHAVPFAGDPGGSPAEQSAFEDSRNNFLALVFCLMVGTAALPHVLMRCYTTPSVAQTRQSITWSLVFILLLYLSAPALAVMVKHEVFTFLVGTSFDRLPAWIAHWTKVDPTLLSVVDVNLDGLLQLAEIRIGADIVMLAAPEIGGLPYVVSGMVAAGGLAAALSTADGLLLTIANALSHDVYHRMIDPGAPARRRVMLSKMLLLLVALAAAGVAVQRPTDIVFLVSAAFSVAASALFPALVLAVFWRRANKWGAVLGMSSGLAMALYYMVRNEPWLRGVFGIQSEPALWFGIQPISAGVFGVPLGFAVMGVASLLTGPPDARGLALVDRLRAPGEGTSPGAPGSLPA